MVPHPGLAQVMLAAGSVMAPMSCSDREWRPPVAGSWFGVFRRRKARRRNRAGGQPDGPVRARCFSAGKEEGSVGNADTANARGSEKDLDRTG